MPLVMKEKDKEERFSRPRTCCPECGSALRTCWVKERMLRKECSQDPHYDESGYCGWVGKPYTPPKKPIPTTKIAYTVSSCWEYEGFDQFGHTFCVSEGFSSKAACTRAAKKEIDRMNSTKSRYGKCVAVVWPPTAKVRGSLVK